MFSFSDSWTQLASRPFHLKYIPPDCSNDSPFWSVSHLCRYHWYQDKEIGAEPDPLIDTCCFSFAIISFSLWITLFVDYELKIFLHSHFSFHIPSCWFSHAGRFISWLFCKEYFCENSKRLYKNNKQNVLNQSFLAERPFKGFHYTPKNLNHPLKTLNKKLGKEKIKTYLCSRYKK